MVSLCQFFALMADEVDSVECLLAVVGEAHVPQFVYDAHRVEPTGALVAAHPD